MTDIPTLTCVIVDDEPTARYGLRSYINRTPGLSCVAEFQDAVSFSAYLDRNAAPDIVFMDIRMPIMSGMEFLANRTVRSAVIIVTAYEQYAISGYELDVTDYLLKPVSYPRFVKATDKAREYLSFKHVATPANQIFVRADRQIHRIEISDIIYIESIENYIRIFTPNDRIVARSTLKEILSDLPDETFIRVHKSYIVNINHIKSISNSTLTLQPTGEIPISRTYRHLLRQTVSKKRKTTGIE